MKNDNVVQRATLAATAALLFAQAPIASVTAADEAKIKCEGVNACKGQSACHTAQSACAGQNACKGKGFVEMTKAQCDAAKQKQAAK